MIRQLIYGFIIFTAAFLIIQFWVPAVVGVEAMEGSFLESLQAKTPVQFIILFVEVQIIGLGCVVLLDKMGTPLFPENGG